MNFTNEQMNKARSAKSAEELLAMAKEAGIEMTEAQAAKYFAELNKQGELTDDELTSVAGGSKDPHDDWESGEYSGRSYDCKCPLCGEEMTKTGAVTCDNISEISYDIYTCGKSGVSFKQKYLSEHGASYGWYWQKE